MATRRRPPADEDPGTANRSPSPLVEAHPDAPTVVPPRPEDQDQPCWSLPVPTIPPAPRSPGLLAPALPYTVAPSAAPPETSLPVSVELDGGDDLRKMRDTIIEQIVQMPLEQLHFCRKELEALHAALTCRWRGLLREALEWATAAHLARATQDPGAHTTHGRPKTGPLGVDIVARVRQHAWWLSIDVPGTLRTELVDAVLPRLIKAAQSAASLPPLDSTAAVRWVEQGTLQTKTSDSPATPPQPTRGGHAR